MYVDETEALKGTHGLYTVVSVLQTLSTKPTRGHAEGNSWTERIVIRLQAKTLRAMFVN